jgi:precorrin-2 dehydrogenase/sirohydrochlorin ferrochelatase
VSGIYPVALTQHALLRCVVIGGGAVAERKVSGLLEGGAAPTVISPTLTERLDGWRAAGRLTHHARRYADGDLAGATLVFAATGERAVNSAVAGEAARRGLLCNIADDPEGSGFHTVASVRRGDLLLTAGSAGASPALIAHIRRQLEQEYGDEYARLLSILERLRNGRARALAPTQRRQFWEALPYTELIAQLRSGQDQRAEQAILQCFQRHAAHLDQPAEEP